MFYSPLYLFLHSNNVPSSVPPGESSDTVTPRPLQLRDIMGPLPVHFSPLLTLILSFLLLAHPCSSIRPQVVERASSPEQPQPSGNTTGKTVCPGEVVCRPGVLLPVWLPLNPPLGEQAGRAIVYFACLMYIFLGVSIIADRFMASIEVITSQVLLNNFATTFSIVKSALVPFYSL